MKVKKRIKCKSISKDSKEEVKKEAESIKDSNDDFYTIFPKDPIEEDFYLSQVLGI